MDLYVQDFFHSPDQVYAGLDHALDNDHARHRTGRIEHVWVPDNTSDLLPK
jgi:hypothetical protein